MIKRRNAKREDRLCRQCIPLAKMIARRIARRYKVPQDDAESEAMLALVRAARTFDPMRGQWSSHAGWNVARDLVRWAKRQPCQMLAREAKLGELVTQPEQPTALQAMDAQLAVLLSSGLPLKDSTIVRWFYGLDGREPLSLRAIGRRMRISHESVRQRLASALAKLREAMSS